MSSPIQRRFLHGSHWTARRPLADSDGECHFEVIAVPTTHHGDALTLRAVLTHREYRVTIGELADDERWLRGWQSLPPPEKTTPRS